MYCYLSIRKGLSLACLTLMAVALSSCTDLTEQTFGVVDPDNFYQNETEVDAAMAPIYANLRGILFDYHNIGQHASDETMVPTRGGDWDDGGLWRDLQRQNWGVTHGFINGAWGQLFTGVARANSVLSGILGAPDDLNNREQYVAEVRAMRAFYYSMLMDYFGAVPVLPEGEYFVDPNDPPIPLDEPGSGERVQLFNWIVGELNDVVDDLAVEGPRSRMSQGAVHALLASLYLNAEVYTGTVTEGGLQRGEAMWQQAINHVEAVEDLGIYFVQDNWWDSFAVDNANTPDNIFTVEHAPRDGQGFTNQSMSTLHYNQPPAGAATPWNGFTTLAEYYERFDEADERRDIFLEGQQYDSPNAGCFGNDCWSEGNELTDRQGNPLVFTPEQPIQDASESAGIRVLKWELDPETSGGNMGNNYAFFRMAEMYLIKAEALNELGQTSEAISIVNDYIRSRVFDPPQPLNTGMSQAAAREAIFNERQFELTRENKRRTDQIRAGTFLDEWEHKANPNDGKRILFPIPQQRLDANPNLAQNPGY